MARADLKVVSVDECEHCGDKLLIEPAQIGLKPGDWPAYIGVVNDDREGLCFERQGKMIGSEARLYRTRNGARLVVLND